MDFKKIYENAASEKLGIPKGDYEDAKGAIDALEETLLSLVDALGTIDRTKKFDLDARVDLLGSVSSIVHEVEHLKKVIETGKDD